MFKNRKDAGLQLARELNKYKGSDSVVLGIPLSGIEIGYHTAQSLGLPFDFTVVRKIGNPDHENFTIGAASTEVYFIQEDMVRDEGLTKQEVARLVLEKQDEARDIYRKLGGKRVGLENKTAILVDDGLATGMTAALASRIVKIARAKNVVLALPVAYKESLNQVRNCFSEIVCLYEKVNPIEIGQSYHFFPKLSIPKVKKYIGR